MGNKIAPNKPTTCNGVSQSGVFQGSTVWPKFVIGNNLEQQIRFSSDLKCDKHSLTDALLLYLYCHCDVIMTLKCSR